MKSHIKVLMVLSLTLLPLIVGCTGGQKPVKIVFPPEFGDNERPQSAANPNRFEQESIAQTNSIEAAIEMSEKYDRLSNEANELKQKNKNLQQENQNVRNKYLQTQAELDRTQKELGQANDLIMEMRVEINNWKADVLGFREEMRQADIAQLQTLTKIVELLGGDVPQKLAVADNIKQPQPTVTDPNMR